MGDALKADRPPKPARHIARRVGFDRALASYADATARLAALAAANDKVGSTSQLHEVNRACRVCHGGYKEGDRGPPKK